MRHVYRRRFHFVEITDWWEVEGKEYKPHYTVELSEVDILQLSDETIKTAIASTGMHFEDGTRPRDFELAEILFSYGNKALLWQWSGPVRWRLERTAKRVSEYFQADQAALDFFMARPVNKLGTSALDYMKGNINMNASPKAGYYFIPPNGAVGFQVEQGKIPFKDPLAYITGFMAGLANTQEVLDGGGAKAGAYLVALYHGKLCRDQVLPVPDFIPTNRNNDVKPTEDRPNG